MSEAYTYPEWHTPEEEMPSGETEAWSTAEPQLNVVSVWMRFLPAYVRAEFSSVGDVIIKQRAVHLQQITFPPTISLH